MKVPVGLLGVGQGGTLVQLETEGLRIPLTKDLEVTIRFRRPRESVLEVAIGFMAQDRTSTEPSLMSITPLASNAILLGMPPGTLPMEVFPVNGGPPIDAREYRVDWPGLGTVVIFVEPGFRIKLEARMKVVPPPNQPFTTLAMAVAPNAANLVTVIIREQPGAIRIQWE
jgi:hypothetical protein